MKTTSITAALTSVAALAAATPTPTQKEKRAETFCDQWGSLETGGYIVYNNLWGQDSADSGEQCTTVEGVTSGSVAWSTEWSWAGGQYNVKSYANAVRQVDPVSLADVGSIPSKWSWSYTGDGMVANVAYDLFTASTADGDAEYEIMIWLSAIGGAGPISSMGSTIATPTIAGAAWDLYSGQNGQMQVFSFVAPSARESFDADIAEFVTYLIDEQGLPASQILQSAGAGTEPFVGSNAKFITTAYSLDVN